MGNAVLPQETATWLALDAQACRGESDALKCPNRRSKAAFQHYKAHRTPFAGFEIDSGVPSEPQKFPHFWESEVEHLE